MMPSESLPFSICHWKSQLPDLLRDDTGLNRHVLPVGNKAKGHIEMMWPFLSILLAVEQHFERPGAKGAVAVNSRNSNPVPHTQTSWFASIDGYAVSAPPIRQESKAIATVIRDDSTGQNLESWGCLCGLERTHEASGSQYAQPKQNSFAVSDFHHLCLHIQKTRPEKFRETGAKHLASTFAKSPKKPVPDMLKRGRIHAKWASEHYSRVKVTSVEALSLPSLVITMILAV
jgi:hypothetical protein